MTRFSKTAELRRDTHSQHSSAITSAIEPDSNVCEKRPLVQIYFPKPPYCDGKVL
jgi:hypothetical protein